MKSTYLMLLLMSFVLSGCEAPDEQIEKEGKVTDRIVNAVCDVDSVGCDMDWIVTFPREEFPNIIQILVNGTVIFTECAEVGDAKYHVNRLDSIVEIKLWNYRRLAAPKNKTKFTFEIKKVENCNDLSKLKTFRFYDPQLYTLDNDITPNIAYLRN